MSVCKKQCKETIHISKPTGREYEITDLITCKTIHVIHALVCPCRLMYIGHTERTLKIRVGEHITNILKGYKYHSVSEHYRCYHAKDRSSLQFWGGDRVLPAWRGSNRVRDLCRRQTKWIHLLQTMSPERLNIELYINCFISDYE